MTSDPRFAPTPEPLSEGLPEERSGILIGWIDRILAPLTETSIAQVTVVATLLLGVAHYPLPPELPFLLFYLAPIAAAAWYAERWGYFNSFLAAGVAGFSTFHGLEEPPSSFDVAWSVSIHLAIFLVVAVLTARLQKAVENQRQAAQMDSFTELANSRWFLAQLGEEIERALRYGRIFTVAYLDLDRFKEVNDTMGHAEGDEVLRRFSRVMREATRSTDLAARMGGDEFALLLPETPYAQAEGALKKLRKRILEAMEEGRWATTVSIGAVTFETPVSTADQAVQLADRLMYQVKAEGGNGIRHILWAGDEIEPS